jgi:hypothetical protein
LFGNSNEPSKIGYFDADSQWGKMVLRQAQRHDEHVYRVLSARIILDTSQLRNFAGQDDRLTGRHEERVDRRFHRASDEMMELFGIVDEAIVSEDSVDDVAAALVREDKQA